MPVSDLFEKNSLDLSHCVEREAKQLFLDQQKSTCRFINASIEALVILQIVTLK